MQEKTIEISEARLSIFGPRRNLPDTAPLGGFSSGLGFVFLLSFWCGQWGKSFRRTFFSHRGGMYLHIPVACFALCPEGAHQSTRLKGRHRPQTTGQKHQQPHQ